MPKAHAAFATGVLSGGTHYTFHGSRLLTYAEEIKLYLSLMATARTSLLRTAWTKTEKGT